MLSWGPLNDMIVYNRKFFAFCTKNRFFEPVFFELPSFLPSLPRIVISCAAALKRQKFQLPGTNSPGAVHIRQMFGFMSKFSPDARQKSAVKACVWPDVNSP